MSGITEQVKSFISKQMAGASFMTADVVKALGEQFEARDVSSVLAKLVKREVLAKEPATIGRGVIYSVPASAAVVVPEIPRVEFPIEDAQEEAPEEVVQEQEAPADEETTEEEPVVYVSAESDQNDELVSSDLEEVEKTAAELEFDRVMQEKFSTTKRLRAFLNKQKPERWFSSSEIMREIEEIEILRISSLMSGYVKNNIVRNRKRSEPGKRGFEFQIVPENLHLLNKTRAYKNEKVEKVEAPTSKELAVEKAKKDFGENAKEGVDFFVVEDNKSKHWSVLSAKDYSAIFGK